MFKAYPNRKNDLDQKTKAPQKSNDAVFRTCTSVQVSGKVLQNLQKIRAYIEAQRCKLLNTYFLNRPRIYGFYFAARESTVDVSRRSIWS